MREVLRIKSQVDKGAPPCADSTPYHLTAQGLGIRRRVIKYIVNKVDVIQPLFLDELPDLLNHLMDLSQPDLLSFQ